MKRLLVALDSSDNSTFVLARATELARGLGGKMRLLSVIPRPSVLPGPVGPLSFDPSAAVNAAEAHLRDIARDVPNELRDGVVAEVGTVADVVCSVARSYDADLVVIGAHQHNALARVLGTTAATIVNHIDRPIIVVRPTPVAAATTAGDGRKHDGRPLIEAAAFTGAAAGAVVGAAGGPPGAILGGIIGGGLGLLAGTVLDTEGSRADAHDRDLDDDIGVTSGDLGARESAVAGLDAIEHARRAGSEIAQPDGRIRAGGILRSDHERLEKTYEDLLSAYRSGDWDQVRVQWDVFEPAIRAHMDSEEHDVFPALRDADPDEAGALLADHVELRRLLGTIGVAIELHAVPATDAQELIARLRAHGAREEVLLYPWMDRMLDAKKLRRLPAALTAAQ